MADGRTGDTRDRVVTEAMRLFGEQGFKATTIAQIEAAAGLSPGAGGLYRHFPTKRALLEEGIARSIEAGTGLLELIGDPAALAAAPLPDRLRAVAAAGLRRLEQERDVNRLLLRDLADFPDLLDRVRQGELRRVFVAVRTWLAAQAPAGSDVDWQAVAAVLVGAISHYWVLGDVLGGHPDGVSEERFLDALVALAAALLDGSR